MRLSDSPFRVLLILCDRQIRLLVFFECRAYSNPNSSPVYHLSTFFRQRLPGMGYLVKVDALLRQTFYRVVEADIFLSHG